jgi:hypothetical protein
MKRQETVADWPEARIRIKTLQLAGEHVHAVDMGDRIVINVEPKQTHWIKR